MAKAKQTKPPKRINLEVTPRLFRAIDKAKGSHSRNAAIEEWLWGVGEIKAAAKKLRITKPERRGMGRPPKA